MSQIFLKGFAVFIDTLQLVMGLGIMAMQVLPFVGQAAAPFAIAFSEVVSFTFGGALIVALVLTRNISIGALAGGSLAEMIPVINLFVPGWSLMVWRCVANKKKKEKELAPPAETPTIAEQPLPPRAFDGIRAANDNQAYAKVA